MKKLKKTKRKKKKTVIGLEPDAKEVTEREMRRTEAQNKYRY